MPLPPIGVMSAEPVLLEAPSPSSHGWADEERLTLHVAGRADRWLYVLATGRTPEAVVHWRQGPLLPVHETLEVALELPPELVAAITEAGRGWLAVTVASTAADGREFPRERAGRAALTVQAGRVVGLPRHRWEEAFPDSLAVGVAP